MTKKKRMEGTEAINRIILKNPKRPLINLYDISAALSYFYDESIANLISLRKLNILHTIQSRDIVNVNINKPVGLSGARPSGVDEPNIFI